MGYEVEIRRLKAQRAAAIRAKTTIANLGHTLGELFPEVTSAVESQGARPAGSPYARYYHYGEDGIDLEAGIAVSGEFRPTGRVAPVELPSGDAAVTVHTGHYDKLPDAYVALTEWMKNNDRSEAGAPWEVYVTDPGEAPDSAKWETEVVWPIS